jgi:uncharacterized protein DUF3604
MTRIVGRSLALAGAVAALAIVAPRLVHVSASTAPGSAAPWVTPSLFAAGRCRHADAGSCDQPRYTTFDVHVPLEQAIAAGGNVAIYEGFVDEGRVVGGDLLRYHWPHAQNLDPTAPNWVSARTTSGAPVTTLGRGVPGATDGVIVRAEAPLAVGDCIVATFGDRSLGSPGYQIPDLALTSDLVIEIDPAGNGASFLSPHPQPRLHVSGMRVESLDVIASATPPAGPDGFATRVVLRAIEGGSGPLDNRWIVQPFRGRVVLGCDDPLATLPPPVEFGQRDRGVREVEVTLRTPGVHRIVAHVEGSPEIGGRSNPIVAGRPGFPRLYFGQLHTHSAVGGHSTQTTRFALAFADRASGLDFVAVSEHCRERTFDFSRIVSLSDRHDQPGRFVTLPAYEWTSDAEGHRHVVFRDSDSACAFCERAGGDHSCAGASTLAFLEQHVRGLPALLVVHHPAWRLTGFTWGSLLDDPNQRLVEVYSWHGGSEYYDNPLVFHGQSSSQWPASAGTFVRDAIAQGYRLGICADADNHFAMPGTSTGVDGDNGVRYSWNGVMAVAADGLERGAVWDGLWNRRTYGTTGARILLDVRVGDVPMGGETTSPGPPAVHVRAVGVTSIEEVLVLRDGTEEIARVPGTSEEFDATIVDEAAAHGQTHAYTVRLQQTDGQLAWSSPIWVTIP